MISEALIKTGWRYLLRRRWQSLLMIVGIILGVSVVVSIDIANVSASRAFDLSSAAVSGRTTHSIVGGPEGVPDSVYVDLRLSGVLTAGAPVIREYVSSQQLGGRVYQLIGIDPFSEREFRDYFIQDDPGPSPYITQLLVQPGTVLISTALADEFELASCPSPDFPAGANCKIELRINGSLQSVRVVGFFDNANSERITVKSLGSLDEFIIADISTVQELTGRIGKLDRINLILPESCGDLESAQPESEGMSCPEVEKIRSRLPPEVTIVSEQTRSGNMKEMTEAFHLNLTALSLLALIVGMFLIYNTMTFSVLQRRGVFGILRTIGVTRQEIFFLIIGEALLVGVLGALVGVIFGILLGQLTVRLVTQTINDLYFLVSVRGVQLPWSSLIKGLLLGVLATTISAIPPAWEAAASPPRDVIARVVIESKARRGIRLSGMTGLLLIGGGATILLLPSQDLVPGFAGTLLVIIGFAMLTPLATEQIMKLSVHIFGKRIGTLGRMAHREVNSSLSRTSIAVAALTIALSVTIGISVMVNSFRRTVITWLDETLAGDVYLSVPSFSGTQTDGAVHPSVIEVARRLPEVVRVDTLRAADIITPSGPVHIAASDNPTLVQERMFASRAGSLTDIDAALDAGEVLISEPLANRLGLEVTDTVTLSTKTGLVDFSIAGIYYDYSSSQGTLMMRLSKYRQHWSDDAVSAVALRLIPEADPEEVAEKLAGKIADIQSLDIQPNETLREEALDVFDRTFLITGALRFLAILVAFTGILNALLSWQLEKQREAGILKALGLSSRQLWNLILTETGLMGAVAGLLAAPAGVTLAAILVYIINRRSFGWTMQLYIEPWPFFLAFLIALAASLLAGAIPARKLSLMPPAEALHYE